MNNWKKIKIEEVCSFINGYAFDSNKYVQNGIQVIRITNVQKGYISDTDKKFYKEEKELERYKLIEGDLLISLTGNVGRVGVIKSENLPAYLNQRVSCVRIKNNNLLNKRFLFNFLNSDSFEKTCIKNSKGIAQKNISTVWLREIKIPLPAMEEQKKIAARLDAVSDLLAKQKQLLSEQDNLIQSTFYDMFGDPIKNNKGWKIEKFKELGTLERGKSQHRPRNAPELLGGPYPLIQTGDIAQAGLYLDSFSQTYSELGLKQSRLWKKGTLCITIAANIAKTSILNFDACFPDSVVGFVNNTSCNIMFIQIWMSFLQKILENNAPQAAQKNINLEILGNLNVIVPPLELQEKFAAVAEQIESEKSKIKSAIAETQTLFNAMMSEYFEE